MPEISLPRRKFLTGLISFIAAPAVVKAASLMPVKSFAEGWFVIDDHTAKMVLFEHLEVWWKPRDLTEEAVNEAARIIKESMRLPRFIGYEALYDDV